MQKIFESQKSLLTFFCLLLAPYMSNGQYFVVGQDPAEVKWKQIQTSHFQIIYPSDYDKAAQHVAHIFEKAYQITGTTLLHLPKKISVILHSKTQKSNGFVAWSPSRVELYPTPGQDSYSQEWIQQLAIHELRHHVQIDKIESELPALFRILFGEQAASIVVGAYLPFWFLEGDAVVTETALSNSGRGRLSSFSMELKAQADEKGIYSFDKAYLGSFKDYLPDYYQLGYQMVSKIRSENSGDVWGKVLGYIARNPLRLNSLRKGLTKFTGKTQDEHYTDMMKNLMQSKSFEFNSYVDSGTIEIPLLKISKDYASYRYPNFVSDTTFLALKSTLEKIPQFVLINNHQQEKARFTPGSIQTESVGYTGGRLVWIESKTDHRWMHKERSLMRILDVRSGNLQENLFEEKLFAPAISPDGELIATVKYDDLNQCSIVVMNSRNFQMTDEFKMPESQALFTPSWSTDQNLIFFIGLSGKGKSIYKLNLTSRDITLLTEPTFGVIKKPIQNGNHLFYTSDFCGKEEVFAINLQTSMNYRILTAKYGITDLQCSPDGRTLLFADYSSNGFKIGKKEVSTLHWEAIEKLKKYKDSLADILTAQESRRIDFAIKDSLNYESKKYPKTRNLFNVHSWSPVYIDPDQSVINNGFSVISQNKLTTAITQLGYDYSSYNRAGKWIGKFEYAGWYPIFRIYGDFGKENSKYYQINKHFNSHNTLISQDTVAIPYVQKIMNIRLDAAIPLDFSHGKMYRMVEPEIQFGYTYRWQDASTPSMIFRGSYIPFTYRIYAHNLLQKSLRDIQSKWGQMIDIQYRHTPLGDKKLGNLFAAQGTLYLPGLHVNHGLQLYSGYQIKNSVNSNFGDLIYYPRGYTTLENNQLFTFRSDYVLPLVSPDWRIWHLYYLKRITMRIHYDFAKVSLPTSTGNEVITKVMSSTGAELLSECHFLRFIAPVKLGVRESFLFGTKTFSSEFILSVNLRGM